MVAAALHLCVLIPRLHSDWLDAVLRYDCAAGEKRHCRLVGRHMQRHQQQLQQYLPAANAPMKSVKVIKMGIVMIGRCWGADGGPGLGTGGVGAGRSLCFLGRCCCSSWSNSTGSVDKLFWTEGLQPHNTAINSHLLQGTTVITAAICMCRPCSIAATLIRKCTGTLAQ